MFRVGFAPYLWPDPASSWPCVEVGPIANAFHPLGSTSNQVGRRLAIIGDDINMRYDAEFRNMLKTLQPTKDNAYEYFTKIASR